MLKRPHRWWKLALLPMSCALLFGIGFAQQNPDIQVTTPIALQGPDPQAKPADVLTVEQRDLVTIIATVSNTETVPVAAAFDILFQLQLNGGGEPRTLREEEVICLTSPNTQDRSRCTLIGLSARGDVSDQVEIRARLNTSELAPGQYTVVVVADPDNRVVETVENNNVGQGLLTVRPKLPNLTLLAETSFSPAQPQQGDLFTIAFTVENDRPTAVTTEFRIDVAIRKRGEIRFDPLVPPALSCPRCTLSFVAANNRETIRAQFVTVLLAAGEYQLRITVDANNDVQEADESDNVLTVDFVLGDPPRNLTLAAGRLSPANPAQGRLASLQFAIRNESIGVATGVELQFSLRQTATSAVLDLRGLPTFACGPVGSFEFGRDRCRVLTVASNGALDVLAQFSTADLALGSYELRVVVDPDGLIPETNERDNTLLIPFAVVELGSETPPIGPELQPIALALVPGSPVVQGQRVLASVLIKNNGNRDSGQFRVEFSWRREDSAASQGFVTFNSQTIPALRLGRTMEVRSLFDTAGLDPGLYALRVTVDALGQVELDTNNNSIIVFLTVDPRP
jgi:uncharacterized protein (DUF2141 family)